MDFLIAQDDAKQLQIELVGGKSSQLFSLMHLGLNIPKWISVSAKFLEKVLFEQDLNSIDEENLEQHVFELIQNSAQLEHLKIQLQEKLNLKPNVYYAVRSSMLDEDGKDSSYAGLMHSFLYQSGLEQISTSVCKVLASAFSSQALMFRKKAGGKIKTNASVMIQEMIASDVSGVCFTVNPQTGRFDQTLINANFGLCESVVAGLSACDEFIIENDTDKKLDIQQNINQKQEQSVFDNEKLEVIQQPLNESVQKKSCLSDDQIQNIYFASLKIAQAKQYPQDIEWTIKDNKLYILQARAITRVGFDKQEQPIVWDNSNIQESYYGVTTPLTFSFIQQAYKTVYEQTMKVMGLPDKTILEYQSVLNNLLGCVHGQVYYNINNWYKGLLLLPGFNKNKRDMEEMMGLTQQVDFIEDTHFSAWQKLKKLPGLLFTYAKLLLKFAKIKQLSQQFNNHFNNVYQQYDSASLQKMSFTDLVQLTLTLKTKLLENWSTPIINDFYVMMKNGQLTDYLNKHNVKNASQIKSLLIFNHEQDIESTEPTKEVIKISEYIKCDQKLTKWFLESPSQLVYQNIVLYPELKLMLDDFIQKYGDRCIGELKLETKTYRQQPFMLIDLIVNYLKMDQVEFNDQPFMDQLEDNPIYQNRSFKKKLEHLKNAIAQRENMRFARTRMFGLYREIFIEIGKRLTLLSLISQSDDVFYLKWDEIINLNQHTLYDEDLKLLVQQRKAQAKKYEEQDPDNHFKTSSAGFVQANYKHIDQNQDSYQGLGCFPGIVKGQIKKVENHKDIKDLQGKILLAKRTDPGWTPLFPTCSAVIVERGSVLSHSAIIARELGLVAVVNVENICEILNDGDWVEVDGTSGVITKIENIEGENHE